MKINEIFETTCAGSMASVSLPLGNNTVIKRTGKSKKKTTKYTPQLMRKYNARSGDA